MLTNPLQGRGERDGDISLLALDDEVGAELSKNRASLGGEYAPLVNSSLPVLRVLRYDIAPEHLCETRRHTRIGVAHSKIQAELQSLRVRCWRRADRDAALSVHRSCCPPEYCLGSHANNPRSNLYVTGARSRRRCRSCEPQPRTWRGARRRRRRGSSAPRSCRGTRPAPGE